MNFFNNLKYSVTTCVEHVCVCVHVLPWLQVHVGEVGCKLCLMLFQSLQPLVPVLVALI